MENKLIEKVLREKIIGCAMSVSNELGHGYREKTYENALIVELTNQGLDIAQQTQYPVLYKGVQIDTYIPDLIVNNKIIIEMKTVENIDSPQIGQTINYLKVTGLRVGLIFNFKKPKLEWKAVVF